MNEASKVVFKIFLNTGEKSQNVSAGKGELILKCLFGVFNSNNEQKHSTCGTLVVKSNFFVRFLGELKILPKNTFRN